MSQIVIYPRLYTTRRPEGNGVIVTKGDATIETLYNFHVTNTINTTTWPFRKEVLDSALRLFGNFEDWLNDQLKNPRVVGYNQDFIKDCLLFTRTGRRELSVQNWLELVTESDNIQSSTEFSKVSSLHPSLNRGEASIQLIQNWCSHPSGIEDLIWSLHILFGYSRPRIK